MDLLSFIKPLKIIITKRFVLIKKNRNFKRKYDDKQFKYKNNFQFGLLIFVAKCCIFFIAFPLRVIVRTICLFDNFEKIMNLTRILERYVGRVVEGLLRTRISNNVRTCFWLGLELELDLVALISNSLCYDSNFATRLF